MASYPTTWTKRQKEMARKRMASAQAKAEQTGRACNIFIAIVYWNPTRERLEGSGYLPEGTDIPDVNEFVCNIGPSENDTDG
jgi:hypothetical protein